MTGDILKAEAGEELRAGQLVKLIAVPFDGNGAPDAVCMKDAHEGGLTDVTGQGHFVGRVERELE